MTGRNNQPKNNLYMLIYYQKSAGNQRRAISQQYQRNNTNYRQKLIQSNHVRNRVPKLARGRVTQRIFPKIKRQNIQDFAQIVKKGAIFNKQRQNEKKLKKKKKKMNSQLCFRSIRRGFHYKKAKSIRSPLIPKIFQERRAISVQSRNRGKFVQTTVEENIQKMQTQKRSKSTPRQRKFKNQTQLLNRLFKKKQS